MSTVYRVAKWREVYETADSRKHKALQWVSMPIDRQSSGYQSLIEHFPDDAPAIYGAWGALVSVAAQCPERGVLANSRGEGYTAERIARLAFMPVEPFRKLLEWASSEDVKWLEVTKTGGKKTGRQSIADQSSIDQQSIADQRNSALPNLTIGAAPLNPDPDPDLTEPGPSEASASCPALPNASESEPPKRSSQSKGEHLGFREWYAAYPRPVKPKAAAAAYAKAVKEIQGRDGLGGKDPVGFLLNRAKAFAASGIGKGDPQFIPHPATWLNTGSYDDDEACWARGAPPPPRAAQPTFREIEAAKFRARHAPPAQPDYDDGNLRLRLGSGESDLRGIRTDGR